MKRSENSGRKNSRATGSGKSSTSKGRSEPGKSRGKSADSRERAPRSSDRSFSSDRPKKSFDREERPRKPFNYDDRPKPPLDREGRPRKVFDRDERPRKSFGAEERPRKSFDRDEKPKRSFGEERPRKSFDADERPRKSFGADERPRKSYDRDEKPKKSFGAEERPRKSFDRDERQRKNFGAEERPRKSFDRDERPRKSFGAEERPRKSFDRDERPRKSFGAEERPRKSFDRDERPRKPFDADDRPKRFSDDREERPRKSFDADDRPKRFSDEYPKKSARKEERGPRRESTPDAPFGKFVRPEKPNRAVTRAEGRAEERPEKREGRRERGVKKEKSKEATLKKRLENAEKGPVFTEPIRLNRYIAMSGMCSRREADEMIEAGVVSVNGNVVTELGSKVNPGDDVRYNGERIRNEKNVYILLNKPKDYITTTDDPESRKTVMELVADACTERIYPVGRLDRNTTGLLLFTNDGDLARGLTHPSSQIKKLYGVELDKGLKVVDMKKLVEGVDMEEDGIVKVDDIAYDGDGTNKKLVGVEIHSGQNRIVRRLFEKIGYEVIKLDRVMFAGLTKKDLTRGRWRALTDAEVSSLKRITAKMKTTK